MEAEKMYYLVFVHDLSPVEDQEDIKSRILHN